MMNTQLKSINQLLEKYVGSDEEILFVFDVDLVITMAADLAYHPHVGKKYQDDLKPLFKSLSKEQHELVYSYIASLQERSLVEENFPHVYSTIKSWGHKTLALTAQLAMSYHEVDTVERRLLELSSFKINFEDSFSHVLPFWLHETPKFLGGIPHYRQGVFFSHGTINSKGSVLQAFLKASGYTPKKVVFLDDMPENVRTVQNSMDQLGIPCDAWIYNGIYEHAVPEISKEETVEKWTLAIEKALQVVIK